MTGESANSVADETPRCIDPQEAQISESPKRCGAQLRKKPGQFCQAFAVAGRERCRLHGGASPLGCDHPSYVSGAYSRALPRSLKKDFDRFLNDRDLMSARAELAVIRTRLLELSGRIDRGETAAAWQRYGEAMAKARAACEERDLDKTKAALAECSAIAADVNNRESAWDSYIALCERFTAIAGREARRLVEAKLVASVDQVRALFTSVAAIIMREVPEPSRRAAIAEALDRLNVLGRDEIDATAGTLNPTTVLETDAGEET